MKKIIALLLVVAMMLCLVACNGKDNDKGTPGSDGEPAAASNTLSVCLASEPDTIDPALNSSVDGGTMCAHLFAGISKWAQDEDGNLEFKTEALDADVMYDEIGSVLRIKQIRKEKQDLLASLEMYYRVFFLGEEIEDGEEG